MKLEKIINKAVNDMAEKGFTSSKTIKTIKDNFDQISADYDFLSICLDCHFAFNEVDNFESDNAINANHSVSRLKSHYKYHYHFSDGSSFSWRFCPCCDSKLGGDRFFYIVFN